MNGGDGESERWRGGSGMAAAAATAMTAAAARASLSTTAIFFTPHPRPRPPPSPACLSSLEGRAERRMIKKMEATQSSRPRRPFIYSETITLASTCTLLQTANLGSRARRQCRDGGATNLRIILFPLLPPHRPPVGVFVREKNKSNVSQSAAF